MSMGIKLYLRNFASILGVRFRETQALSPKAIQLERLDFVEIDPKVHFYWGFIQFSCFMDFKI